MDKKARSLPPTATQMDTMSRTELLWLIKRLQLQNSALRSLASLFNQLCFERITEEQRIGFMNLARTQASIAGVQFKDERDSQRSA